MTPDSLTADRRVNRQRHQAGLCHLNGAPVVFSMLLSAVLSACGLIGDGPENLALSEVDVRDELLADGASTEIADCVVQLADNEIERNNYDEILEQELRSACAKASSAVEQDKKADDSETGDSEADDSDAGDDSDGLAFTDERGAAYGDDRELDELWDDCEKGSGQACDDLFDQAPFDSAYEQFGLSCGNRPDILRCSDLDKVDEGPVPEVYIRSQEQSAANETR